MTKTSPHEIACRSASLVSALLMLGILATLFLPVFDDFGSLWSERANAEPAGRVALYAYAVPVAIAIVPLVALARGKPPGKIANVIGAVMSVLLAGAAVFILIAGVEEAHKSVRWVCGVAVSLPTSGLFLLAGARRSTGWERWARITASTAITGVAFAAILVTLKEPRSTYAEGANILFTTLGAGVPIALWVVWPWRRAPAA
jgi:hypothetical protein